MNIMRMDDLLRSWNALNRELTNLTEADVLKILGREMARRKRPHMVKRLHTRYSTLRQERELADLLERCSK
jgi:hypothetical protein